MMMTIVDFGVTIGIQRLPAARRQPDNRLAMCRFTQTSPFAAKRAAVNAM
jgi:hypothetical protein